MGKSPETDLKSAALYALSHPGSMLGDMTAQSNLAKQLAQSLEPVVPMKEPPKTDVLAARSYLMSHPGAIPSNPEAAAAFLRQVSPKPTSK